MENHFEFHQYKECFDKYRNMSKPKRLVISEHWASSGYWIEKEFMPLSEYDTAYEGRSAEQLMKRVEKKIKSAENKNRGVARLIK